jgi:hypothetical protein
MKLVGWKPNKNGRLQPVFVQKVDLEAARRRVKAHENWEKAMTQWQRKQMCRVIDFGVKGARTVAEKVHGEVCRRMAQKHVTQR